MSSSSSLTLEVVNNSGIDSKNVFIGFWGKSLNAQLNESAMAPNTWYKLSEVTSLSLLTTTSGRFYIAYNDTFTPNGDAIPSVLTPSSDGYNKRFDKFELTFDGSPYSVADLTAIDFWSIPMSLSTSLKGVENSFKLHGLDKGVSGNDVYTALKGLSNPVQSTTTANDIISSFKKADHVLAAGIEQNLTSPATGLVTNSSGDFVRIIGPNTYPPFGEPNSNQVPGLPFTPYNTFLDYIDYLIDNFGPNRIPKQHDKIGDGRIAHISGEYGGSNHGRGKLYDKQSYDVWAHIDQNGDLHLTGTGSKAGAIDLYVSKWDLLNPAAIYGGSPQYALQKGGTKHSPGNDIYAWVFGDFFAGLNIGAIGSSVKNGDDVIGDMPSQQWFNDLPKAGLLFDKLWPSSVTNYWNQWAQVLNGMSDAYNFAYAERFSAPQISIAPASADTLTLTLLPAAVV